MNEQVIIKNHLVSYFKSENAGQKCLLFLHGWRSQKEVWETVIKRFKDLKIERLDAYAIDLPGFGVSSAPAEAWSVGDYAEVVRDFIEKMELKNIIIIGHSFGGRVGIKLAAGHPELVNKLVLVDSAGFIDKSSKNKILAWTSALVRPFFRPKFMQGMRRKIYQSIGASDYLDSPGLQRTFVNVVKEDLSEDMKGIKIPTLIITGENDKDTPIAFGEKMQELIPNSKFQILKNAGHYSFLDQREEFVKIVEKFINTDITDWTRIY